MKNRLRSLISNSVAPLLQEHGFHRINDLFICERGEFFWCVEIQQSRWNIPDRLEFTLNVGVYVPGVMSLYLGGATETCIALEHCCIYARIGMLSEEKLDIWWSIERMVEEPVGDEVTGNDVQNAINSLGIPFLERFKSQDDVLAFLLEQPCRGEYIQPQSGTIRLAYAAILLLLQGKYAQCQGTIDRAVLLGEKKPGSEHLLSLRKRLIETIKRCP